VSNQMTNTQPGDDQARRHEESLDLTGLDHIFRWASEVVADGDEPRAKIARERRIRKQVLEMIQQQREQQVRSEAQDEIAYLQRRVIALSAKVQEVTEENGVVKQVMLNQSFSLERLPRLEAEIKRLKMAELEKEAAVIERRLLMDSIAKVKVERDYLVDVLGEAERENVRLAKILKDTQIELDEYKQRRWWHIFFPQKSGS
jgi:hypothetical protein